MHTCIFGSLAAVIKFQPVFFFLHFTKNEVTTTSHLASSFAIGAHSFRRASLLVTISGKAVVSALMILCLSVFWGGSAFSQDGYPCIQHFFSLLLVSDLTVFFSKESWYASSNDIFDW